MTTDKGVWNLQQVRDKQLQSLWSYSTNVLSLYSWGYNNQGALGQNNKTKYSSPVQVGSDTTWAQIGAGTEGSSCVIKNDGTLWTWGQGSYGVLGHSQSNADAAAAKSTPNQLAGTTWNEVAGQQQGMYAVKTDGALWSWGIGSYGQLGHNNRVSYSSPVQVGSDTTWNKPVVSNASVGGAIKTDGTLWTWGRNDDGMLGHNQPDNSHRSSPVQVGSDTTWAYASIGREACLATKTDGTLWTWGKAGQGALGQNAPGNSHRSSPVQIPGATWATGTGSISASDEFSVAIKSDGTMWAWGLNEHGQLGHNEGSNKHKSSPVQVPGTTWRSVFCGRFNTFATKTDGTMWSWGYNSRSSTALLAQNNQVSYSSPVQIGSETDWHTNIGGSMFATLGMRMS